MTVKFTESTLAVNVVFASQLSETVIFSWNWSQIFNLSELNHEMPLKLHKQNIAYMGAY